jgi:hypothetical protein
MRSPFITALIQTIESHCAATATAILFPKTGGVMQVQLRRDIHVAFFYGDTSAGVKDWFIAHALNHQPARLVIRSLTTEIDPVTRLRIKELRGYDIAQDRLSRMSADELGRMWCDRESVDHVARVEATRFC